jgi:hypothetical protein
MHVELPSIREIQLRKVGMQNYSKLFMRTVNIIIIIIYHFRFKQRLFWGTQTLLVVTRYETSILFSLL